MPKVRAPAIRSKLKTPPAKARLRKFMKDVERRDFKAWRRAKAVLGYIQGQSVIAMCRDFDVARGSINRWLQWYDTMGIDGLRTVKPEGRPPRLDLAQKKDLASLVEAGPQGAGFDSGVWTGPMIASLIRERYGVDYHNHHIPRLLHTLGFSVQRPRKKLARADSQKQAVWLSKRLPSIKKKPALAEAS